MLTGLIALVRHLRAPGLGGAAARRESGIQRFVLPAVPGVAAPRGARVIPAADAIDSKHQAGFVVVPGWRF
jgi:hypothetical protein